MTTVGEILGETAVTRADTTETELNVPRAVYKAVQRTDNLSLVLLDAGIVAVAWLLAFVAGFESAVPHDVRSYSLLVIGIPVVIQVAGHRLTGLYGPVWRYASIEEGVRLLIAVIIGVAASTAALGVLARSVDIELPMFTTPAVATLLILLGCGGVRFQSRLFALERQRGRDCQVRPSLDRRCRGPRCRPGLRALAHGVRTRCPDRRVRRRRRPGCTAGRCEASRCSAAPPTSSELCRRHGIDRILIALPNAGREQTKPIIERALRTEAQVKVLPPSADAGRRMLQQRARPRPERPAGPAACAGPLR